MCYSATFNQGFEFLFSGEFKDVRSDFQSKVPAIYATVPSINLKIQIGVNNGYSVQTSKLLAVYNQLDARVQPLTLAFRYWAKVGHQLSFI